jgi:molecular chaperone Hsp33
MQNTTDLLRRFIFDNTDIRGEIVSLEQTLSDIFEIQHYPEPIKVLLGEFLAAASLLVRTVKFEGSLSLQARGNGDLSLIVAEINHNKKIRAVAEINDDAIFAHKSLRELLGQGMLSIIITPNKGQRYQGIVALEGDHLAQCLEGYFMQSEQLPTRIWLSSDGNKASGLLLQHLPQQLATKAFNQDAWETQAHLASTLSDEELRNTEQTVLLTRLFHETGVRVFEPDTIHFGCSCSKERSSNALLRLGKEELQTILQEEDNIKVDCHFCGFQYLYFSHDIDELFSPETQH